MGNGSSSHSNIPRPYQPPSPYPQHGQPAGYPTRPGGAVPPQRNDAGSLTQQFARKYQFIPDSFTSVEQVQQALREAGLESSNLIVGVDFTKSNEWTGKRTFAGKCLHATSEYVQNPYEKAISVVGKTLEQFDDDQLIPAYGFGDATTHDQYAFSFNAKQRPCHGFQEVLSRYRAVTPYVKLAGPTSFAPIIETAVRIVEESGGQYHVLLIIADGQVTRSSDLLPGQLSPQEKATIDSIVAASNYPLSIIMVGVGDGPWDIMRTFDDSIPNRNFDNFQFVDFSSIMCKNLPEAHKEAQFALAALMEIPSQYKACNELRLIGRQAGRIPPRKPLEPPPSVLQADARGPPPPPAPSGYPVGPQYAPSAPGVFPPSAPGFPPSNPFGGPSAPSAPYQDSEASICPICFTNRKDMVFQCGHQTCHECGQSLKQCPICRAPISTRIKMFG